MLVRGRGIIGKRGRGIPRMCWCCGGYTGEMNVQPDGKLLHDHCKEPAARDYPNRPGSAGEQVDDKVAWLDVRGDEEDVGAFWAR